MSREFYIRKAKENIPNGYYILTEADELRPSDLVWSWPTEKFHRADWSGWQFSPLVDREEMICAIRNPLEGFEGAQTKKYTLKK